MVECQPWTIAGRLAKAARIERLSISSARATRSSERNWRTALGELDIVASSGKELVFVEVRRLESGNFGVPEESVGAGKQRRLARLATAYVQHAKYDGDWRIDVIAIDGDGLRHIKNAVSLW